MRLHIIYMTYLEKLEVARQNSLMYANLSCSHTTQFSWAQQRVGETGRTRLMLSQLRYERSLQINGKLKSFIIRAESTIFFIHTFSRFLYQNDTFFLFSSNKSVFFCEQSSMKFVFIIVCCFNKGIV